mgnify:CR=1 FL=1
MEKIASFTIDHIKLQPGLYVSRKDHIGAETVTTFDLRFKRPNTGDLLTNAQMHSVEHVIATLLRNSAHKDAVIYFAGPTAAPPGKPIGACGPTTSSRMDPFSPLLLDEGLLAMVGKGERSAEVCDAIIRNKAVYFCAVGGAGALAAAHITACEVIAYDDLGCESVKKLTFEDFPLLVAIDNHGGNLFEEGRAAYGNEI